MKLLFALLTTVMMMNASLTYAESSQRNTVNNQNFSRRPHVQVPEAKTEKTDTFEAATLVEEEAENAKKYKTIQLHMLGRRPYAEKSPE